MFRLIKVLPLGLILFCKSAGWHNDNNRISAVVKAVILKTGDAEGGSTKLH